MTWGLVFCSIPNFWVLSHQWSNGRLMPSYVSMDFNLWIQQPSSKLFVVGMVIYFLMLVHNKINHLHKFIHDVTCRVDPAGIAPPVWWWVRGGTCRNVFSDTDISGCGAWFPLHSLSSLHKSFYLSDRATPISVNEKWSKETEIMVINKCIFDLLSVKHISGKNINTLE